MSYGVFPDLSNVKKVLLIKLRHLGDVLLTTPLFHCLKEALPHASIDAYVYEESREILSTHPDIHSIVTYDRKWKSLRFFSRLFQEIKLLSHIRKEGYDLVINLTEGDRGAIVARASGAPIRVGWDPKGKGFWGKKNLFTHLVKVSSKPRHTVETNLDALRVLGIFPKEEQKRVIFHPSKEANGFIDLLLQSLKIEKKKYIVLHATSRWLFKSCSIEKFQEWGKFMISQGETLLLTGSNLPKEKEFINAINKKISSPRVFDLSGELSISQLGSLIEKSKLLVTVDSLPLHLASALSIPTLVFFGPTCEQTWGPWMNKKALILSKNLSCRPCHMDGCGGSKRSDCLDQISLKDFQEAFLQISSQGHSKTGLSLGKQKNLMENICN